MQVTIHGGCKRFLEQKGVADKAGAPTGELEVKLYALLGNYDRPTNQLMDGQMD